MANILRDGFDFYGAVGEAAGNFSSMSGNCTLSATTRFGVGQSLQMATSGLNGAVEWTKTIGFNTTNTIFLHFAFRKGAALGGDLGDRIRFYDGGTMQFLFRFLANGSIEFWRGDFSLLLGTYASAFQGSGVWNHFQMKIVIDNAVGSIEVRRDGSGTNDFEVFNVDTQMSANAYATAIDACLAQQNAEARQFDDFWIFDNAVVAGEPSNWMGDIRAVQFMPNADSAVALSRSAGATNFSNVDELTQVVTDYVFGAAAGLTDEYTWAGFGVSVPTLILGVTQKVAALKTDAGVRTVGVRTRSGATVLDSAGRTVTTGVLNYPFNIDLNPNTGAPWTAAELAAISFGPRIVT